MRRRLQVVRERGAGGRWAVRPAHTFFLFFKCQIVRTTVRKGLLLKKFASRSPVSKIDKLYVDPGCKTPSGSNGSVRLGPICSENLLYP